VNWLRVSNAEFFGDVLEVRSLIDGNRSFSSVAPDFESKKPSNFAQVGHSVSVLQFRFETVNRLDGASSYDHIVCGDWHEDLAIVRVAIENGSVDHGRFESHFAKIAAKPLVPFASRLLQAVESLLQATNKITILRFNDSVRRFHVDLVVELCIEVGSNDINLVDLPVELGGDSENEPN
jgi:hypothetical protein